MIVPAADWFKSSLGLIQGQKASFERVRPSTRPQAKKEDRKNRCRRDRAVMTTKEAPELVLQVVLRLSRSRSVR